MEVEINMLHTFSCRRVHIFTHGKGTKMIDQINFYINITFI